MQAPTKFSNKLLLIAQFWGADSDQMLELLRLFYDMEDGVCPYADIALFPRKDTKIRNPAIYNFLAEKFYHVHRWRSRKSMAGWPGGPNAVAMDAFKQCHQEWKAGRFEYAAAMLIESDCVPTRRFWHKELLEEWHQANKLVLGHWDGSGTVIRPPTSHMNGNLLFHPSLFDHVPEMAYGSVPAGGWDMAFWPRFAPYAAPSRLIYSDYRLNTPKNPLVSEDQIFGIKRHTYPDNPLVGQDLLPCYIHGIKGMEGIEMARRRFFEKSS